MTGTISQSRNNYTDIWDGDGWQINKNIEGKYVLFDAVQPWSVPASACQGVFETFDEAAAEAEREGRPDWSEWIAQFGDD